MEDLNSSEPFEGLARYSKKQVEKVYKSDHKDTL